MKAILKSLTRIFIVTFLVVFVFDMNRIIGTDSSFSDMELSSDNSFVAGKWEEKTDVILKIKELRLPEEKQDTVISPTISEQVDSPPSEPSLPVDDDIQDQEEVPDEEVRNVLGIEDPVGQEQPLSSDESDSPTVDGEGQESL
ncbi:MAG: hypothetical protein Q8L11_03290 [Candidatus Moranbacteria bacterium]|nr:hypothetical protein [Candidatus Moranbacteria bacterium]